MGLPEDIELQDADVKTLLRAMMAHDGTLPRMLLCNTEGKLIVTGEDDGIIEFEVEIAHGKTLGRFCKVITTATDTELVALTADQKIKVFALSVTGLSATKQTVKIESNVGGTLLDQIDVQSPGDVTVGKVESVSPPAHLLETAAGHKLNCETSAAVQVIVSGSYFKEA